MIRLTAACLTCAFSAGGAPAGPPVQPPMPALTRPQGAALVSLVRSAMRMYLTDRIDAKSVPRTAELKPLRNAPNAAAVTLRSRGAVVALEIRDDGELCLNVAAAALRAMRSSKLPDRVDRQVLDALTVEVEVLSPARLVAREKLPSVMVRGLTGLAYSRRTATAPAGGGAAVARVLPSGAYVLGLDADQMRRGAMSRFRLTSENAARPARLEVFTSRHYVGFPDGRAVEMFRGKDLRRREGIGESALAAAAGRIGEYLVRHQVADGRYSAGGLLGTPREQMTAACAMAKLARRRPSAPQFACSAAKAVAYGRGLVKVADGRGLVAADSPKDALAATALLAMALSLTDTKGEAKALRRQLQAALAGALAEAGATTATTRPTSAGAESYMAYYALAGGGGSSGMAPARLKELREGLSRAIPAGATARLWAYRAGIASALPIGGSDGEGIVARPAGALPDEVGGYAVAGGEPSTTLTGLAAVCLARALRADPSMAGPLPGRLAEARRFCYRMMYQPSEAYFEADRGAWQGAVRLVPGASLVSLPACAAGIEAALAGQG